MCEVTTMTHPDEQEEREYQLFAAYDAKVEAYGDRCPGCGTLRWGGDCPKCFREDDELRAEAERLGSSPEVILDQFETEVAESRRERVGVSDDIEF
jgi:hypothetical protein